MGKKADILIQNGLVIDPYLHTSEVRDIAVAGTKIIEAGKDLEAAQVIDASGCIVSPGLIDFHGHFADQVSDLGASAEMICFPTGITTIVDGGTTGAANYLAFRSRSKVSKLRTYALLHMCPAGITTITYHEPQDPQYCQDVKIKSYMELYADQLIGLKVRQSKELVGELGLKPLRHLRRLADEIGCFLAVHTTNPPCSVEELVALLRPGDVYCHVYQGKGATIIDPNGHVNPAIIDAQKRGVIFDAANGKNHFAFSTAEAALADGFLPDIISTDMSAFNAYNRNRVFSLPFIMSKYLLLGMKLEDIYERVILNPARKLEQEKELGSLCPGTVADIAVHRIVEKETRFDDAIGGTRIGSKLLRTEMTVNSGAIVFRTIEI